MKRKLLVLLCLVVLSAFVLASCDIINQNTPSGNDGGSNNTDGSTDNGGNNNGNGDGNGDQTDDCIHTFSEAWARNSSQHWHAATCEHTDQKSELAAHSDEDQDGLCDVCSYNVGHTHTFATEWESNELAHWHVATCKHTDEKGDYAAHTDVNANGKCDVCDADVSVEVEEDNYGLIIEAILNARGGVCSGEVIFDSEFISLGNDGYATSSAVFEYVFGSNCAYFKNSSSAYSKDSKGKETTATSVWEKWQEMLGTENVFGVFTENDSDIALDATANLDTIKGYYFAVSTLANEYGVENILYTIYTLSTDSSASDVAWDKDEDIGVYTLTFNYLQINRDVAEGEDPNVNYYELTVSFAHNENYVLTSLDITCECYTNSLSDERDHDYTYDDTTGTITMKPEGEYAADTYTFKVTQVAGDRTYVNENPRSKFLPESFELFTTSDLTVSAADTITVNADKIFYLYLGNFLPEGTSITFDPASFRATIEVDGSVYESDSGAGLYNEVLYFAHTALGTAPGITCRIFTPGTYVLTVSIGTENTKTVTIIVTDSSSGGSNIPAGETVSIEVNVKDMYINGTFSDWSAVKDNADYIVSFTADKGGMYTVNIPEGLAAYDKQSYDNAFGTPSDVGPWVDLSEWNPKAGSFDIYLEEGQTYEFYVATYVTGTYVITYYYHEQ